MIISFSFAELGKLITHTLSIQPASSAASQKYYMYISNQHFSSFYFFSHFSLFVVQKGNNNGVRCAETAFGCLYIFTDKSFEENFRS